ncbi:MAG: TetR/AcrR family transcriptional regulator [Paenibacillaceae bacterium]|nr:TetR/AcrR family transcriptional regulator [Paenibacillaceae bacterium]
MTTNKPSLRDTKREATAHALAEAAFGLAREKGLDGFIVEDVVQRAGYSRRTFANHFSCKEEAVASAAVMFHGADEVEHMLANVSGDMSPLDILQRLMKMQFTTLHLRKLRELVLLAKRFPSLEPYILMALRHLQATAQELVQSYSRGRYPDAYPHLLAGAVYGGMLPLLDGSLDIAFPGEAEDETPGETAFDRYLESMFGYLRSGF